MGELAGHVAFVSGGTGGLGRAICHALARAGANVSVGYHRAHEAADALVRDLAGVPRGHLGVQAAVTDSSALLRAAQMVEARYGRCDILVNCAGTTRFVPHDALASLDDELIDEIFRVNVRGVLANTRAFIRLLEQSAAAVVVNISSIAGTTAMGSNVAYCASKAAVNNLTLSLGRAFAPKVRFVSVAPGLVDTEFVRGLDASWREEQIDRTPMKRLASPEQVADAVLAVITKLKFTTGVVVPVDGGRPLA
ncbi:MAG: SDR family NAD(P)-dependent oxidoreductase [Lautropia sp.]